MESGNCIIFAIIIIGTLTEWLGSGLQTVYGGSNPPGTSGTSKTAL